MNLNLDKLSKDLDWKESKNFFDDFRYQCSPLLSDHKKFFEKTIKKPNTILPIFYLGTSLNKEKLCKILEKRLTQNYNHNNSDFFLLKINNNFCCMIPKVKSEKFEFIDYVMKTKRIENFNCEYLSLEKLVEIFDFFEYNFDYVFYIGEKREFVFSSFSSINKESQAFYNFDILITTENLITKNEFNMIFRLRETKKSNENETIFSNNILIGKRKNFKDLIYHIEFSDLNQIEFLMNYLGYFLGDKSFDIFHLSKFIKKYEEKIIEEKLELILPIRAERKQIEPIKFGSYFKNGNIYRRGNYEKYTFKCFGEKIGITNHDYYKNFFFGHLTNQNLIEQEIDDLIFKDDICIQIDFVVDPLLKKEKLNQCNFLKYGKKVSQTEWFKEKSKTNQKLSSYILMKYGR